MQIDAERRRYSAATGPGVGLWQRGGRGGWRRDPRRDDPVGPGTQPRGCSSIKQSGPDPAKAVHGLGLLVQ